MGGRLKTETSMCRRRCNRVAPRADFVAGTALRPVPGGFRPADRVVRQLPVAHSHRPVHVGALLRQPAQERRPQHAASRVRAALLLRR